MATPDFLKNSMMQGDGGEKPIPKFGVDTAAKGFKGRHLNLRAKATVLAIAIGTLPVLGIGATAYYFANQSITQQISKTKQARAVGIVDKVNRFIADRNGDIQVLANLPIIANSKLSAVTTLKEKEIALNHYLDAYLLYDNIVVFDLQGNIVIQSLGTAQENDRDSFQEALKSGLPIVSKPGISKSTGKAVLHFAAPVKDSQTGKTIGVIRSRMPVNRIDEVIANFGTDGDKYYLIDQSGKLFAASVKENVGQETQNIFSTLRQFQKADKPGTTVAFNQLTQQNQLLAYAPFTKLPGMSELEWKTIIAIDTSIAFAPQRQLLLALGLGTGTTVVLVGLLAAYLANRATRPIIESAEAVRKIGRGELDTRVSVSGQDELADLGTNINTMAAQIQDLLTQQEKAAQAQMAAQAEITQQQLETADQERQRSTALQTELMALLQEVGGASDGDLTVRAAVSAGEIGIVADFFNSIVESLRGIVARVKLASAQVNTSIGSNEAAMGQLADEAQTQAQQITETLRSVEQMAFSVQQVAENARRAAEVSQMASLSAAMGGKTMDRTVESIVELRETVTETAQQVKRLGESSKKISKAVTLINQISLQTNVLAVNASIEAARAGEEGQGFAVVAEEVAALAAQSAAATKEIEQIVRTIQSETSSVVKAMERGTTQVDKGARQVEEAKESLQQIVQVSQQIDELLQSISSATVSQTETSEVVKLLMTQINQSSARTSDTSRQVSSALQATVAIAEQLQASVGTFKVEADSP